MSSLSLSLSRTGSLCYASSCVARAHSYASGVKILFFIFLAYFLGNTRHKREMKQTRKKPRVASVREWQTGKLLLFRPPIEEGERKTPEKTKHTCRDSISFFFFFLLSGILVTRFGHFSAHLRHYLSIRTGFG
jgi:hypothetical protein